MISYRMPKKTAARNAGMVAVTFTLAHVYLNGRKLALVGDFNAWDPHSTPMLEQDGGPCTAILNLVPGRYRFRYLAEDGQCFTDEATHPHGDDDRGGQDSILDLAPGQESADQHSIRWRDDPRRAVRGALSRVRRNCWMTDPDYGHAPPGAVRDG